ncbi:MAG: polysaccharide deacetylase family protein [Pyrinomonadaceae bacterium]
MNKSAIANLLVRANAFAPFRYLNRSKLLVLMYHRFSEDAEFGKTSRRTFETHLRYLTQHYRVISLSEAVARLGDGGKFPNRSAVITVDDGYRDFFEIGFPVLKSFRVPSAIYLVTEFVAAGCWIWTDKARYILTRTEAEGLDLDINGKRIERALDDVESRLLAAGALNSELKKLPDEEKETHLASLAASLEVSIPDRPVSEYSALSWDHAREMAAGGVEIGSHTATHPILTNVEPSRVARELSDSIAAIRRELDQERVHFCYPNGNVSGRERDAAEAAGYASAVTTEIRLCENDEDRFMIPRIDAEPELRRFVQATSGFDRLKR